MLRRTVDRPVGISLASGNRTDIDDQPSLTALDHHARNDPGDIEQSLDVRIDHLVPVQRIALVDRFKARSQPRIINQDVDRAEMRGQRLDRRFGLDALADIESQRMYFDAVLLFEFVAQFLQAAAPPRRNDQIVPRSGQFPCDSFADPRRSARNQCCLTHNILLSV